MSRFGRAAALYFGYTRCRDVCPQTLKLLGRARARAGLSPASLAIVMVSVDPQRDTPAAMRAFFARLHVRAIGITGQRALALARSYGIGVQRRNGDIGHTDAIVLIDAKGYEREVLDASSAPDVVAADLRAVVH